MSLGMLIMLLLMSISISILCFSSAQAASATTIDGEIEALMALKRGFIDPESHLSNWVVEVEGDGRVNYSISPCQWKGIQCSSRAASFFPWSSSVAMAEDAVAVESLDLSYMNLSGSVSSEIGKLSRLVNLSIAVNNLSGPLPAEISQIGSSLRYLNISNNLLSGDFPAQNFSNLESLEVLDAYNNNFTGSLPLQISKLSSLKHLHLGGNYFEGAIPPQYGSLQNLTYLALSGNSLTGRIPVELGDLALLEELYLGYFNLFDGGIPAALGRLTKLVRLDMADCGLTGTIPPHLQNLTNLDSLFLQINGLTGPIPGELGAIIGLRSLDLSNNLLSGHIPAEFASLKNLELLNLFRNHIHGSIPYFIGELPYLQVLSLWENNITGVVPAGLGAKQPLLIVDLSSNAISGPIPHHLCSSGTLQRLVLFNNRFSEHIPASLASCWNLIRIRLGQNQLSGSIPAGILSLPSLQMLEAPDNRLSGRIPSDIPPNSKLGRLDLSGNLLTGAIPFTIAHLSSLQTLILTNNQLTGEIPREISSLRRLSKLDISGNAVSGAIPPALGKCDDLTYLDLSRNQLHGQIPSELQYLGVLDYLNLSRNHLSGSIPATFVQMQTLTAADFSFNNLSGAIPEEGQFATFNSSSFIGNAGLCGAQLSPCSIGSAGGRRGGGYRVQSEPALAYWIIVGTISSLTVIVFVVGVFYNRHAFCSLLGRDTLDSPWKLTAFQKVDFTAEQVLASLTDDNIIGKGGSGTVYRCATPSGYVAVKRLPAGNSSSCSGSSSSGKPIANGEERLDDHGYSAEIQTLGKIRHRNIVRLLGCCSSRDTNLLVYEYMINGSLGELLHGPRAVSLDWPKRYKIALEAACGLRYLHHDCSPLIVHRDVKSNNILLDSKYEAHVADFGLARALDYPESMSSVAGSYGYIAPEYVYTLKVDEKSDIYSFGVVLLELLTGKRPFEPEFGEGVDITQWVKKKVQTREGVLEVLDTRMGVDLQNAEPSVMAEMMVVLRVALHCLVDLPMQRPTMHEVVQMLTDLPKRKPSHILSPSVKPPPTSPPDLISI